MNNMHEHRDILSDLFGIDLLNCNGLNLRTRMLISDRHIAPNGYLHATAIIALADITCGRGTDANLPEFAEGFTTIELKSNFMGTCRTGYIYCDAVAEHIGRTTQVWSAAVSDELGRKLALFRCTQLILKRY